MMSRTSLRPRYREDLSNVTMMAEHKESRQLIRMQISRMRTRFTGSYLLLLSTAIGICLFVQSSNAWTLPVRVPPPFSSSVSPSSKISRIPTTLPSHSDRLDNDEVGRYSRHLVLSDVGMAGQLSLKNSAVLVIGAGGLGSPCLLYLAAAGVGHIGIVDADTVDMSNLQRQIIHGTSTLQMTKCQSAATRIRDLNPLVDVRVYEEEFTSETARRILGDGFSDKKPYDVVIDGSDNFPTKYLIK